MSTHPHFCACCSVLTWEAIPCPELEGHTCKECAVLLLDAEVRLEHAGITAPPAKPQPSRAEQREIEASKKKMLQEMLQEKARIWKAFEGK